MSSIKILVAVPAYNCAPQIGRVIRQYGDSSLDAFVELVIIDNCSNDTTLEKAIDSASLYPNKRISIIRNDQNYSLGGTHKVAFQYALEESYDGVVILHGDDQGSLSDIEPYLDAQNLVKYDCILGARFMKDSKLIGYSLIRVLGNTVFNLLYTICAQQRVFDLGSGLNFFSRQLILESIHKKMPDDLTFNCAFLLGIIAAKKSIQFIPITWREEDQVSNAKLWSMSIKLLKYLVKYVSSKKNYLNKEFRSIKKSDYSFTRIK
jgi:glycosyltransferase involved in cell wall biosynthesis